MLMQTSRVPDAFLLVDRYTVNIRDYHLGMVQNLRFLLCVEGCLAGRCPAKHSSFIQPWQSRRSVTAG
jgi:hypothetical protein